uniref:Amine oxidase n=3 Tax=Arion vulgaris TaxID=1028688 RepID=A0A0B7BGB7_9EUPU
MWSFDFRMSTIFGPGIYDVRFLGERIAYEINLGEIVVFYSGYNPMQRQTFYVDSFVLTGSQSQSLIAGADCPTTATFLPLTVTSQAKAEPAVFPRAICIFEQNLGTPIRRHHNYDIDAGVDYGGMLDSALVVRSIHTIDNYDYIIDFTFHQNGALGVSIGQSGFLMTSFYTSEERPYGVRLTDRITGAIHVHLANFKVDLDINGTSNRFETLDIVEETVQLREARKSNAQYSQTRFSYNLKETEKKAAYKHDFNKPMYHIFHNNNVKNKYGERKAYRLVSNGMVKQLLQKNVGNEGTQPWARYQVAVTQRKDTERTTGNMYAQWADEKKIVDFEKFIEDDENIVDKDLVAWVTLGFHHIPHTEDLPVTTTSGKHQTFYLFPYNYHTECPSMMSRDAVYISLNEAEKGLKFDYHGTGDISKYANGGACKYKPHDPSAFWMRNPDDLLEVTKHNGVI